MEETRRALKEERLVETISQIRKRYGDGAIMRLGSVPCMEVNVIPTGSLSLDIALGVGGIPRGRVTEIYGPEGAGKTTLAQHIIAEAQKSGGVAAFIDVEHALDPDYAARCGVDVANLWICQPDSAEQALEITRELVQSGAIDVVVIDSVAALVPQSELEGEMGDPQMGLQARLMSQALRKLCGAIKKSNTSVVFTNQLRMRIGIPFGNPETTPGGRALKFYACVRLDIRSVQAIKDGPDFIGNRTRVRVTKNKVAPPFRVAEFDLLYDEGISREGELLDLGTDLGVISKSGAYYSYGEIRLGHGRDAARGFLRENRGLAEEIQTEIAERSNILTLSPSPVLHAESDVGIHDHQAAA